MFDFKKYITYEIQNIVFLYNFCSFLFILNYIFTENGIKEDHIKMFYHIIKNFLFGESDF